MATIQADIQSDIEIEVDEFHSKMTDCEKTEMITKQLQNGDLSLMDSQDREKFYKDFAYHVGGSDTEFLNILIDELTYWRRK